MSSADRPPSAGFKHISETRGFDARPQPARSADPDSGGIMTRQGWLSWADIHEADGRLTNDANGNRVLQFPTWTKELGRHYRVIPEHKLAEGGAS